MPKTFFWSPRSEKRRIEPAAWLEPGGWLVARALAPVPGPVQVRIDLPVGPVEHLACSPWCDADMAEASLQIMHRIPARLWARAGDVLRLTLVAADQPIAPPVAWRRSALAAEIGALMATGDMADGLAALDLARHAEVWAHLPTAMQRQIAALAADQALADLVPVAPVGEMRAVTPPPVTVAAHQTAAYDAARRADLSADPMAVLLGVLGRERADPYFLLAIAGDFCLAGQILALVDLAMTKGIRFPPPAPHDDWLNASLLPFLLLSGDEAELRRALFFLSDASKGWLVTPVLGWFGAHLADHAKALRAAPDMIRTWMRIVEAQAGNPWGRAPCRVLIAASQRLIAARKDMPSDLADEVADFALRTYWLSPTFWSGLVACGDLPERLATGGQAFAALQREVMQEGEPAPRLKAAREGLDWLRAAGVHGIESFRWECPGLARPDPTEDGEALLRAFAAPGAHEVSSDQRFALHRAIAAGRDLVASPPGTFAAHLQPSGAADTLVMVRSSRARQCLPGPEACRRWLSKLDAFGVAHVIAVGGQDTVLCDTVLELPVGDGADALVHKTLAMLSWAADAGYAHVWLVEDETLLDPEAVFGARDWRQYDFYGHRQTAPPGFRHPALGAGQIDLSPQGGVHADAGLGYALSHRALVVLRTIAASARGARIAEGSNIADKAIADLLHLGGIHLEGGEHTGALLRPRRPGGLCVPQGAAQGFMPGWASGERAGYPGPSDGKTLAPTRLWPATIAARATPAGRALTLVAGHERVDAARNAPVAVICTLRNERFMVPHFLDHYRRMGVTSFLIADNGSDDGTAELLAQQPDTVVFSAEAPFREAVQGTEWKIALMAQLRPGRWSLVADTDELLIGRELRGPGHALGWRGGEDLGQFLARPQWRDHDAFRIRMLDLYPEGPLAKATFACNDPFSEAGFADREPFRSYWLDPGPFSDRQALRSALRHRLIPQSPPNMYVSEKVALVRYRPWMRFSVSMHYAAEVQIAPQELIFGHFKYTSDFEQKVRREVHRGQYFNDAAEYRKYAEIGAGLSAGIADPAASGPWRDAVSDVLTDA